MWRLRMQRWQALRRGAVAAPLRDCWRGSMPRLAAPLRDVDFLVCDAEMSGLDAGADELLSLGWVRIHGGEVCLDSAEHHLIRAPVSVGVSATVHQLRDCDLVNADRLESVLSRFLAAARGHVLVFHHAPLDTAFLDVALRRCYGAALLLPVVDTLALERRLQLRTGQAPVPAELGLQACRARYGLGDHAAHNALADAIATAELLLAHCARRGSDLRLRDVL